MLVLPELKVTPGVFTSFTPVIFVKSALAVAAAEAPLIMGFFTEMDSADIVPGSEATVSGPPKKLPATCTGLSGTL